MVLPEQVLPHGLGLSHGVLPVRRLAQTLLNCPRGVDAGLELGHQARVAFYIWLAAELLVGT